MLTIQEMEVFLAVVEQGSFSQAARFLNLSQPTVSQVIQTLETRLRSDLFFRHRRGIRLTDAGEALLPMAKELITYARRLEENMAVLHGTLAGKVLVGCSTSSGKYILPHLISDFRNAFPQVRVDILIHGRDTVFNKLLAGEISFGISSKKYEHSDLEYVPFCDDEIVLIVPSEHPWASFGHIYPDDLLDVPLILRESHSGTTQSLFHGLLQHDITPDMLNVVMELGNAEAILMAVEENIGGAFVSRLVAQRGLALERIAIVSIEGMNLTRQIHIAHNLRMPFTRSQSEFWKFLKSNLGQFEEAYQVLSSIEA